MRERTGAERYLDHRRSEAPEYAAAFEAQREALGRQHPTIQVPAGMTPGPVDDGVQTYYGTVADAMAVGMEFRVTTGPFWDLTNEDLRLVAKTIVQARYPQKPKTERVHWSQAVGRKDPHDGTITMIGVTRIYFGQDSWMDVTDPDGMVEVLIENQS